MRQNKIVLSSLLMSGIFAFGQIKTIDTVNFHKTIIPKKINPSEIISKKELEQTSGNNLANVLKNIAGVTLLQNGSNISKPVIQGLTNQRIAILNNGVKLESQLWGNDHAPEIDPFLAQHIEVFKGAESIKYGSNTLGGIVLLKSDKLPYFSDKVGGKLQLVGESNSEKWAGNISLDGSFSKNNSFAWRVQMSSKKSGNYKTPTYYVDNTGAKELNYSANLGYQMPHEKLEVFYSFFSTKLGVYRGSRIGSQDDWELRLRLGRPIDNGQFSYEIGNPYQDVKHHLAKISLESNRSFGKFNLVYSFQKNHREEYDLRTGRFSQKPTLDLELTTHQLSLDYEKKHNDYFKNYTGISISRQNNYNVPGNGINSILPNFISDNTGIYSAEEYKKDSWIVTAGLRYDYRTFYGAGYNQSLNYYSGSKKFQNFSYNVGINKSFGTHFNITSNIGMSWRAPEAIELFSNGVDHGSAFYIKGDDQLRLEKGLKWSTQFQYSDEKLHLFADVFLQKLNGFIYEMPTGEYINTWSGPFPVFTYKQSNAFFRGADLMLKYHILPWLKYAGKASVVYANNLSESYYFPSISPENISNQLYFDVSKLVRLDNSNIAIEHQWSNKQKRFSPETDLIPSTPSAYHVFNLLIEASTTAFYKNDMQFSLSVNNLFNHLYKDYTDRFRYFTHAMGRNFQFRINYNF